MIFGCFPGGSKMTNRDPCLALLLNHNNTSQRSQQERQETLMVQVLFFVREETSDDIVIRIVWSKGLHNSWFSLALRPPHVGLVKYT